MPTVLVIDDQEAVLSVLGQALEREGYAVLTATSGRNGLRLVRERSPDLVITDILMPDVEGMETIRGIRRIAPGTPVFVMSGAEQILDMDVFQAAQLLGASGSFAKPIDLGRLVAAVRDILPLGPKPAA